MKKLFATSLLGSCLIFSANSAKADFDHYSIKTVGSDIKVYTCVNSTGVCTNTATYDGSGMGGWNAGTSYVDKENNLIIHGNASGGGSKWLKYDKSTQSISAIDDWKDDYIISLEKQLIRKDSNGVTSIGENSFKFQETSKEMKLWATDSNGNIAPINITNGSKLLINGRDVEQSINNVGALSAALTGLPTVPTETTLACGLGTGTHGGDFAFSGGCASKLNEKLSINYAASMTMPGQDYAGDFEDTFSARAGFVWKLGKAIKPTQISMREGKELKEEIIALKENNQNIISQNKALLARLEKLEKIALIENKSKDLAIYKLK